MAKNGDKDLDHNAAMDEDSSNDGYPDDGFDYRQYFNTMLYNVPDEKRPYVRKLIKDTGKYIYNNTFIRF